MLGRVRALSRLRALALGSLASLAEGPGKPALRALRDRAPEVLVRAARSRLAPLALGDERGRVPEDELPQGAREQSASPLVSIVVPTCGSPTLAQCVASLAAFTTEPESELVVADDASGDPRQVRLSINAWRGAQVLRSETRRGFPASVNAGARAARGSLLVVLNDDVIVTPGWLEALREPLARPDVALVGPSASSSGDEAEIPTRYRDLQSMLRLAASRRGRGWRPVRKLSLLCALVRREAFDEAGGLDEGYGLGFFDDDELCAALRARGWVVALAEGAFVHHHGSRSFGRLPALERVRRFELARARFESRWGRWRPLVR